MEPTPSSGPHSRRDSPRARSGAVARTEKGTVLLDDFPIGTLVIGADQRIAEINAVACHVLGLRADEALGRKLGDDLFSCYAGDGSRVSAELYPPARALRSGVPILGALCGIRTPASSRIRWLSTNAVPRRGSDGGGILGVVVSFLDVTEWREAELSRDALAHRMEEMQRYESLSRLAGGVAHDFNNLLQPILGWASVLLAETPAGGRGHRELLEIERAAHRAAALTAQMLAFAGRQRLTRQPFDLGEIIREVTTGVADAERGPRIEIRIPRDLPPIGGDRGVVRAALASVLVNACEAAVERAGAVTVSVERRSCGADAFEGISFPEDVSPGDFAVISITDTGPGMTEDERRRACEPFFSTKPQGRGLGLAFVLGAVRAHHGALRVKSALGAGTTVTIYLPLAGEGLSDATVPRGRPISQASRAVLVVDDEAAVRYFAAHVLDRAGYTVETASDGLEALALLHRRGGCFGVAVIDLTMPTLDGRALARAIHASYPAIRLVLSSGFRHDEVECDDADGFERFLSKPYRPEEIIGTVRDLLPAA